MADGVAEWPKYMYDKDGNGVVVKDADSVPEGHTETPPEGASTDDGTGVSLAQRQAANDLKDAEDRKRAADQSRPPGNASPASEVEPNPNADGHNGIEFRDAGGRMLLVADVDTMERDKLQNTLQAMGVAYDGRWGEDRLRAVLTEALANPAANATTVSSGVTDTRATTTEVTDAVKANDPKASAAAAATESAKADPPLAPAPALNEGPFDASVAEPASTEAKATT